jgi:hypothetical protein
MIHSARDLTPEQKRSIESLLGRSLRDDEDLSIRAFSRRQHLSPERRQEVLSRLDAYFAQVDAQRAPLDDAEVEDAVNEALRSTRPGFRPVR